MSQLDHLLDQGKTYFQAKKYEACMTVVNQVLSEEPENAEAVWLMKEAQRQWEDQRSIEELEIYVENLKKEAMDLFDKEHYERCLGMFRFLIELEPENKTLQDYLQLSQRMFLETIGTESLASELDVAGLAEMEVDQARTVESSATPVSPVPAVSEPSDAEVRFARSTDAVQEIENHETPRLDVRSEVLPKVEAQENIESSSVSTAQPGKWRSRIGWLSAFGFLLVTLFAARLWLYPWLTLNKSMDIQSNPTGANVFLNNELKGQTPFHLERLPAGTYGLRVEKDGYLPYGQSLVLGGAQTVFIVLQLEKVTVAPQPVMEVAIPVAIIEPRAEVQPEEPPAAATVPPVTESLVEEPISYSVIHHHVLGSCTGRIKIDGDIISFHPAGSSRDGFTRRIKQIDTAELSDKLTIEFKRRTYRFETLAGTRQENHQRLAALYERIKRQQVTAKR